MRARWGIAFFCLGMIAIPAGASPESDAYLGRMMAGGPMMEGKELEAALAKADQFPLGSAGNPVRAEMPGGQRAYLARLRCADGRHPAFARAGNVGPGVFLSIVDDYVVDCGEAAPGKVHVQMDMYFKGHVESRAVPGFTIDPVGGDKAEGAGVA